MSVKTDWVLQLLGYHLLNMGNTRGIRVTKFCLECFVKENKIRTLANLCHGLRMFFLKEITVKWYTKYNYIHKLYLFSICFLFFKDIVFSICVKDTEIVKAVCSYLLSRFVIDFDYSRLSLIVVLFNT